MNRYSCSVGSLSALVPSVTYDEVDSNADEEDIHKDVKWAGVRLTTVRPRTRLVRMLDPMRAFDAYARA